MNPEDWVSNFDVSMASPMIQWPREAESRRPGFSRSRVVRLADGVDWWLPEIDVLMLFRQPRIANLFRDFRSDDQPKGSPEWKAARQADFGTCAELTLTLLAENYHVSRFLLGELVHRLPTEQWVTAGRMALMQIAYALPIVYAFARPDTDALDHYLSLTRG